MGQFFLNMLKWFAYAAITLLICLVVTVPIVFAAEYYMDSLGLHSMIESGVYWIIGLAGLVSGIGIAGRVGIDMFSIPFGKVDRDAG